MGLRTLALEKNLCNVIILLFVGPLLKGVDPDYSTPLLLLPISFGSFFVF